MQDISKYYRIGLNTVNFRDTPYKNSPWVIRPDGLLPCGARSPGHE